LVLLVPKQLLFGLWWNDDQKVMAVFTVVIAVATVAYAITTFLLWRETKKSADAAKKAADTGRQALDATHRPYVGVPKCERERPPHDPWWRIKIFTKNFGTLPASQVHVGVGLFVDGLPSGGEQEYQAFEILPGASVEQTLERMIGPLELNDINNGGRELLVRVMVRYDISDGRVCTHTATFAYVPTRREFDLRGSNTQGP